MKTKNSSSGELLDRTFDGELTPPVEIGDGHGYVLTWQERDHKKAAEKSFGSLTFGRKAKTRTNFGPRPGGDAPDSRTRVDPAPCKIPVRVGGPVLLG